MMVSLILCCAHNDMWSCIVGSVAGTVPEVLYKHIGQILPLIVNTLRPCMCTMSPHHTEKHNCHTKPRGNFCTYIQNFRGPSPKFRKSNFRINILIMDIQFSGFLRYARFGKGSLRRSVLQQRINALNSRLCPTLSIMVMLRTQVLSLKKDKTVSILIVERTRFSDRMTATR